jgi:hypothetical protein
VGRNHHHTTRHDDRHARGPAHDCRSTAPAAQIAGSCCGRVCGSCFCCVTDCGYSCGICCAAGAPCCCRGPALAWRLALLLELERPLPPLPLPQPRPPLARTPAPLLLVLPAQGWQTCFGCVSCSCCAFCSCFCCENSSCSCCICCARSPHRTLATGPCPCNPQRAHTRLPDHTLPVCTCPQVQGLGCVP